MIFKVVDLIKMPVSHRLCVSLYGTQHKNISKYWNRKSRTILQLYCTLSQRSLAEDQYDIIVIGGGSGGLACSKEAAGLGKKVAVLDFVTPSPKGTKWDIGGTCVNVGCIPKKLMHHAALLRHSFSNAEAYGWNMQNVPTHDWSKLARAVQMYIRSLNWGHKVQLTEKNIKYINGMGSFVDRNNVKVVDKNGQKTVIQGSEIVIAVGGRPRYPQIPGAREHCMSSDDIFWMKEPPGKTLVIGSSYVGLECAGFLNGLGFDTTLMIRSIPLRGFDQQIAHLITDHMAEEGTHIQWSRIPKEVAKTKDSKLKVVSTETDGTVPTTEEYDSVLFAIGRDPVTSELRLDNAGVNYDQESGKIIVDERDTTNMSNIYAIGDVAMGRPELTPAAIKAGKLLARRLFGNSKQLADYNRVPTTVFTPLEYGCVGLSEEEASMKYGNGSIEVYHAFYKPLEFTIPEQNHKQCYMKVVCTTDGDQPILGLHFLGPHAGELTQGFAAAMRCGITYNQLIDTVGIHPTCAEEFVKLHITKRPRHGLGKHPYYFQVNDGTHYDVVIPSLLPEERRLMFMGSTHIRIVHVLSQH